MLRSGIRSISKEFEWNDSHFVRDEACRGEDFDCALAGPFRCALTVPRSLRITLGRFSRFFIGAALSVMEKRLRKEG